MNPLLTYHLTASQREFSMPNMNKSASTMLPSINTTFCLTRVGTFSPSYQSTKNYLMAPLESILTNKFTLILNQELSCCNTALILFHKNIDKLSKQSSTTWSSLVSLYLAEPLNGHLRPLLFQKRMVAFDKF